MRVAHTIQFAPNIHVQPNITVIAAVQRFEESIAGRVYVIEVTAVTTDRWRAQLARLPGMPTAMMPFYGTTAANAAQQLSDWLTRAYLRSSAVVPPAPPRAV